MCARVSLCVCMCVFTRSYALFFFINRKGLPLYPVPIPAGPAHAHSFWRRPWSTFPPLFNRKQLYLVVFDEEKHGNFKTKEDKETSKSYLFSLITWLQALSWCMWQYRSFWSPSTIWQQWRYRMKNLAHFFSCFFFKSWKMPSSDLSDFLLTICC